MPITRGTFETLKSGHLSSNEHIKDSKLPAGAYNPDCPGCQEISQLASDVVEDVQVNPKTGNILTTLPMSRRNHWSLH